MLEKPFSLRIKDFSEKIINLINSSSLPVYVIKNELEKVYTELNRLDEEEINKYFENSKKIKERNDKK
nr:MAG TPA: hypothetical protein [Caudoviricetes sp.]